MQSVDDQLKYYEKKERRHRAWKKIVLTLASVVVFCTVYALILPAITLEGDTYCGQEEHEHGDGCYSEAVTTVTQNLVCTLEEAEPHTHTDECYEIQQKEILVEEVVEVPVEVIVETPIAVEESENGEGTGEVADTVVQETQTVMETQTVTRTEIVEEEVLICEKTETEGHTHGEGCYEEVEVTVDPELICEKDVHTHSKACYSNPDADVETEADWKKTFEDVTFTNDWVTDTIAIAKTQLEYKESEANYIVLDNGDVKGYTRYGEWYGNGYEYGDWCAMFVSFCLDYAKVEDFPLEAGCQNWINKIKDIETDDYDAWQEVTDEYIPEKGNIIFFNWDSEADSDHVGIVVDVETDDAGNAKITTIEGNVSNTVKYKEYDHTNDTIMGYGILPDQGYYCGAEGHAHETECYNSAKELTCEVEEHIHSADCKVKPEEEIPGKTPEETPQEETSEEETPEVVIPEHVAAIIEEIDQLPSVEEVQALEDTAVVADEALRIYMKYVELSAEEQELVTNKDKLLALSWLWEETTEDTPEEVINEAEIEISGSVVINHPAKEESYYQIHLMEVTDEAGTTAVADGLVLAAEAVKTAESAEGSFAFTVKYEEKESVEYPQSYFYKITQVADVDDWSMVYDSTTYVAQVEVLQLEDGTFDAQVVGIFADGERLTSGEGIVFTNEHFYELTLTQRFEGGVSNLDKEFTFELMLADESGTFDGTYKAMKCGEIGEISFVDGLATVALPANESITIYGLPHGVNYQVKETNVDGYVVGYRIGDNPIVTGTQTSIETLDQDVEVIFTIGLNYKLPKTGGSGTNSFIIAGMTLMLVALCLLYNNKKKEG